MKAARKEPRQERAKVTVDAILRAAAHILREGSFDDFSTNKVAKRAGVSIGSLYQYFPSKEALVVALAEEHTQKVSGLLMQAVEQLAHAPIEVVVRNFIRGMLRVHEADPKLHRVLTEELPRIGGWAKVKELTKALPEGGLYQEGEIQRLKGSDDQAIPLYLQELALHPQYLPALVALEAAQRRKSMWKEARETRQRIAALKQK